MLPRQRLPSGPVRPALSRTQPAASSAPCATRPTRPGRLLRPFVSPPPLPRPLRYLSHTTSTNLSFHFIKLKYQLIYVGLYRKRRQGRSGWYRRGGTRSGANTSQRSPAMSAWPRRFSSPCERPIVFCTKRGQWLISRAGCRIVANREDGSRTARSSHWTSSHESSGCWEERRCVRPARLNKQIRQMTNCLTHLVIVVNESLAAGAHDCNGLLHRRLRFARSSLWPKGRQTLKLLDPGG
jgi:hypothetical protein